MATRSFVGWRLEDEVEEANVVLQSVNNDIGRTQGAGNVVVPRIAARTIASLA